MGLVLDALLPYGLHNGRLTLNFSFHDLSLYLWLLLYRDSFLWLNFDSGLLFGLYLSGSWLDLKHYATSVALLDILSYRQLWWRWLSVVFFFVLFVDVELVVARYFLLLF